MEEKKNQVTKTNGAATKVSNMQQFQIDLARKVDETASASGSEFTEYGKRCVIAAIANLLNMCKTNDIEFNKIDQTMIKIALQNVGYTQLNMNAIPSEAYFDIRKNFDEQYKFIGYSIAVRPQGAGNEKLTREYGVGLVPGTGLRNCWLVREGDEFTYPQFNGIEMTPPTWSPKSYDKKVIMVVYPAIKTDGSVEYLIATREGIKPNLIAQVRQNGLYAFKGKDSKKQREELYEKCNADFEKMSVDEILASHEWAEWLNPTYTSGGSKEAMIIRKMKNNALKNYPKEYNNAALKAAVEDMYEDKDDSLKENAPAIKEFDVVEQTEKDLDEPVKEGAPQDFEVKDGEVEPIPESTPDQKPETPTPETPSENGVGGDNYEEEF